MTHAISPAAIAATLPGHWSPRVIGEVDDAYVKVARGLGTFGWHRHPEEDELFLVLKGRLRIELEDQVLALEEGQMCVVPRGVRHNPVADEECHLLLFERKTTLHTGDTITERTRSIEQQLGLAD